jgi:hypothetical protein
MRNRPRNRSTLFRGAPAANKFAHVYTRCHHPRLKLRNHYVRTELVESKQFHNRGHSAVSSEWLQSRFSRPRLRLLIPIRLPRESLPRRRSRCSKGVAERHNGLLKIRMHLRASFRHVHAVRLARYPAAEQRSSQITAGFGGAYVFRGLTDTFDAEQWLTQASIGFSVALRREGSFRIGPSVRFYSDLGRPTQRWAATSLEFTWAPRF